MEPVKKYPTKKYPTIGACGLDCGLCPRYYTKGTSRCPGCCGPLFWQKHPGCSIITCCVKKKELEFCADCSDFPCLKLKDAGEYDSFLTHAKMICNLNSIKEQGVDKFMEVQRKRINLLEQMIAYFDEGKSRSFYCIACALLPIESLEKSFDEVGKSDNIKIRARTLKEILDETASKEGVKLKLRKK